MKNLFVDASTASDIDKRIQKVLRDLSYAGGKVELREVRELLRLDLQYYKTQDESLAKDVVHKLRIGAKQVIERPLLLLEAIKKFDLKALLIPDRKRILVAQELPDLKKRWSVGHEISHSLLPWHAEYMLGDNKTTLSPQCHEIIEAEANYGAGRLLFPLNVFSQMAKSKPPSLAHVRTLASYFGNTITTTLWRYVEGSDSIAFGLVGEHPRYPREGQPTIAYFIRSPIFEARFRQVTETMLFDSLKRYCSYTKAGPLGEALLVLSDDHGAGHEFHFETFGTSYNALTLALHIRKQPSLAPATTAHVS
jgi:Zn-dependent peptidase ImmA (M78 family)